jgi:Flp pilus assembly protein TadG
MFYFYFFVKEGPMRIIKHSANITTQDNDPASLRQSERGQSLVELAVSITVILLLLAGAVDFSIAYFSFAAMQDAAQEGALYGSVNPTDTNGIITRVRQASSNPVDLADETLVTVNVTLTGDACEGNEVRVNVIYDYPISMPFIGTIIGSQTITLNASVTDTILQPPCSP